jgi:hypothetical protein
MQQSAKPTHSPDFIKVLIKELSKNKQTSRCAYPFVIMHEEQSVDHTTIYVG